MTHPFEEITLNKCINKGQARIWIEGSILDVNRFSNDETFYKSIIDSKLILDFNSYNSDMHKNKISGTKSRPIIDITGKAITKFFGNNSKYKVTFTNSNSHKTITIKPIKQKGKYNVKSRNKINKKG